MFNEEFSYTWMQFSSLLGFDKSCELNIDKACEGYDKKIFWKEIANNRTHQMPRTSNIHNPTMWFLLRFLGLIFMLELILGLFEKRKCNCFMLQLIGLECPLLGPW